PIAYRRRCPLRGQCWSWGSSRRRYRSFARWHQEEDISARRQCDSAPRTRTTDQNRNGAPDESVRPLKKTSRLDLPLPGNHFTEQRLELVETFDLFDNGTQRCHRGRHIFKKMLVPFHESEKTVSTKRLHQALHRTQSQDVIELAANNPAIFGLSFPVVTNQFSSLGAGKIHIWIKKQRRQIVFRQARAHALKIDQVSQAVAHDDVLRLKIAVH